VSFAVEEVGKRNLLMALSSATHIFGSVLWFGTWLGLVAGLQAVGVLSLDSFM